jgi:hypothetical protein
VGNGGGEAAPRRPTEIRRLLALWRRRRALSLRSGMDEAGASLGAGGGVGLRRVLLFSEEACSKGSSSKRLKRDVSCSIVGGRSKPSRLGRCCVCRKGVGFVCDDVAFGRGAADNSAAQALRATDISTTASMMPESDTSNDRRTWFTSVHPLSSTASQLKSRAHAVGSLSSAARSESYLSSSDSRSCSLRRRAWSSR